MEVVEHVADPLAYLTACRDLLKPGGPTLYFIAYALEGIPKVNDL